MAKLPEQFKQLFGRGVQLNEDLGEKMARWAAGTPTAPAIDITDLLSRFNACADPVAFDALNQEARAGWKRLDKEARQAISAAQEEAQERVKQAAQPQAQAEA